MDLTNVRQTINEIDKELKELFEKRLECSKEVARVKLGTSDVIYKPDREIQIYDAYEGDNKSEYVLFIKTIMQISRKLQYGMFADNNKLVDGFMDWFKKSIKTKEYKSTISIKLSAFDDVKDGLGVNDIVLAIAGSEFEINKLMVVDKNIELEFSYSESEIVSRKALALCYLIYCETKVID